MLLTSALLILGLALLLAGGYALVRGATGLAAAAGIPTLVIGLTVVAIGTSAPELAVNLTGALAERGGIAFGNVVGSNLANLGLILGIAAIVRALTIESVIIVREIPIMLLGTAVFTGLVFDAALRRTSGTLGQADGLILLSLFSLFVYLVARSARRRPRAEPPLRDDDAAALVPPPPRTLINVLLIGLGLIGLVAGGRLSVDGAAGLGALIGVPEAVIGLTVVAVGTSLPELVTSLIAAHQGEADLAVGNIVGSNIFNLLFIMGSTLLVGPVPVPRGGLVDVLALCALSLLLLPVAITDEHKIVRLEGGLLVALWTAYTIWRFVATTWA